MEELCPEPGNQARYFLVKAFAREKSSLGGETSAFAAGAWTGFVVSGVSAGRRDLSGEDEGCDAVWLFYVFIERALR